MLIFGHRGAAGRAPENTLLSVRRALEFGAHGIEVDVHFVDGHLVVIHDDTVDRTTNGRGRLAKFTFEELRALDAGLGEAIPTLEEIVELIPQGTILNVELKGKGTGVRVGEFFNRLIREGRWLTSDILVSSFEPGELRALSRCNLPLAILFNRPPRDFFVIAQSLGAMAVNPFRRYATTSFVRVAHEQGLRVFPYTANLSREIQRLCNAGVDGLFTDFPDRAAAIVSLDT
jgi:glycerophosphoryl diester phosphodiesterase